VKDQPGGDLHIDRGIWFTHRRYQCQFHHHRGIGSQARLHDEPLELPRRQHCRCDAACGDRPGRRRQHDDVQYCLGHPEPHIRRGATLTCANNPKPASSGLATFSGCSIDKTGTYTLTAASSGLTNAVSGSFTISTGSATKLFFTTSPTDTLINAVFASQPVVAVQDAGGNTVTSSNASVTLSITSGGGTLTCTQNTKSASSGVVAFAGCKINTAATYTLTANATGLSAAVSNSFNITG